MTAKTIAIVILTLVVWSEIRPTRIIVRDTGGKAVIVSIIRVWIWE